MLTQIPQSSSAGKFICLNPASMQAGVLYTVPTGKKLTADFVPGLSGNTSFTINGVNIILMQGTLYQTLSLVLPAETVIATTANYQNFTMVGYES